MNKEMEEMCTVKNCGGYGPSPLPQDGNWTQVKNIYELNGLTHGVGTCAPQQGACKLTLNIKNGIIKEALVECIGCSGMTHSAAMASEILVGKTVLEALNTDLVCDAINVAMRELFLQICYGRSQSAFSLGGLPVGTSLEDIGKDRASKIATIYSSEEKGTRYFNLAEGRITKLALDENNEIIGYEYVNLSKLLRLLQEGKDGRSALAETTKKYGRYDEAKKYIDPVKE
jgi:NifU-like protein involved in Fe-S cluster formation